MTSVNGIVPSGSTFQIIKDNRTFDIGNNPYLKTEFFEPREDMGKKVNALYNLVTDSESTKGYFEVKGENQEDYAEMFGLHILLHGDFENVLIEEGKTSFKTVWVTYSGPRKNWLQNEIRIAYVLNNHDDAVEFLKYVKYHANNQGQLALSVSELLEVENKLYKSPTKVVG